jgi:beta-galactosidase
MNNKLLLITIFFIVFLTSISNAQETRETKLFNSDWKFNLGDIDYAKEPGYNDSKWRQLNLPHDWSIEQDFSNKYASCTAYLPCGIGWYRKTFDVPVPYKDKIVTIIFDGVNNNSEVWINGHYLEKRPNGYISFIYNLTPYLNFGQKNIISVRVDHTKYADSRWYNGSGINRNVWLRATSNIHIANWGTTITTPIVSDSTAKISIKTSIKNEIKSSASIKIKLEILDNNQKQVAISESTINGNDTTTVVKQEILLKNPHLWNIESPVMYTLKTSVIADGNLIDETIEPFGIRSTSFNKDKGFSINGKSVKLKGVCIHQDGGCVGTAVPIKLWQLRLEKLKKAGCNAIRTSHNPVSTEFLNLCDQMGFVVMDEAFDEWEYPKRKWIDGWNNTISSYDGYSQYFNEWSTRDLHDMVERDKNHPSVIMWSIGNEIDYANDPYADADAANFDITRPDPNRMLTIARTLKDVVKSIDTTRPVTMALADVKNSNKIGLPEILDIVGYNYTESRYESDHKIYPDRIIYGSENPHNYSGWLATKNDNFICSQFLWTGIDYLGEAGKFPYRSAYSGLLDLTGNEKPIYYWRQSMWSDQPMLSLAARKKKLSDTLDVDPMSRMAWFISAVEEKLHWNYKQGDSVLVIAYSNCDQVELFINKKSFGKKTNNEANSCFWWYVPYETGQVKAVGKKKGSPDMISVLNTVFEPQILSLSSDSKEISSNNGDVVVIEAKLLDKNRNCSYLSNDKIEFEVSGEGKLIGTDNGDAACLDNFKLPWKTAYEGRCIAIVQSTGNAGKIIVKAKSKNLPESTLEISVK